MSESEDSWVFDSLVWFLSGPVWNVPILTFIEQKSLIFEPGGDNEDEYKNIQEEYKNLVDYMLDNLMKELKISAEQLQEVCDKESLHIKDRFEKAHHPMTMSLLEQVWAAGDYEIFKRMMLQKNIELQLQALQLLRQRYGLVPQSFLPGDGESQLPEHERAVLDEVLRRAVDNASPTNPEEKKIEEDLATSESEIQRLEAEQQIEKEMLEKAVKLTLEDSTAPASASAPTTTPVPPSSDVDPAEMEKRREYLRQQRDKLLQLKKEEREKQLSLYEKQQQHPRKSRPVSAQAARSAMGVRAPAIDPQVLQARQALAKKLKAEVIEAKQED